MGNSDTTANAGGADFFSRHNFFDDFSVLATLYLACSSGRFDHFFNDSILTAGIEVEQHAPG